MISRLFNNAHVLFQKTNDDGITEAAIAASVDNGDMVVLEQEGRHIVIDPASVPELCRLLKQLQKELGNG